MTKARAPAKDVLITITVSETPAGKLHLGANIPEHAEGTVALVMADAAMTVMREMMRRAGVTEEASHRGPLQ